MKTNFGGLVLGCVNAIFHPNTHFAAFFGDLQDYQGGFPIFCNLSMLLHRFLFQNVYISVKSEGSKMSFSSK